MGATTVKIEIPITATDNTGGGVGSAQRRLTSLDRTLQKTQRQLDKIGKSRCKVDIDAHDSASQKLSSVEGTLATVNGQTATIDVETNDTASQILHDVEDTATSVNGQSANVDVEADDTASQVLHDVEDTVSEVDGNNAVVDIEADDTASQVLHEVEDTAAEVNGITVTVEVDADDTASSVLHDVEDEANALDGKTVSIAIETIGNAEGGIDTAIRGASSDAVGRVGAAAAALGASISIGQSVNQFQTFEQGMANVKAISGATEAEFDALTSKAKEMGATTKFTATESAEAMQYMAMAGWKASDMISGIGGIMNLAAASGESLGRTSDIVTDALTAFGLKARDSGRFSDVLAAASSNSNTNVSMMGESFKYVAATAGAMNYSIEDTAVSLGLMANAGIKSSMSGAALRNAMVNLNAPSEKMQKVMDKYDLTMRNSDGTNKTWGQTVDMLRDKLGGLTSAEQTAAATTLFGKQGLSGMLAVINSTADDYDKLADAIYKSKGAADEMSAIMLDTQEGSLKLMESAIEGVGVAVGGRLSPYVKGFAQTVTNAMPGAQRVLEGFMDTVDAKSNTVKDRIRSMTQSSDWKNADFTGKVNIAWDKIVGEPFGQWTRTKGKHLISSGASSLIGEASKIIPGGEKAGLTSWLSTALIGKGTFDLIKGVSGMTSSLAAIAPAAATAVPVLAAVAAGVTGVAVAVQSYHDAQAKTSFSKRFGDVELSDLQAQSVADQVLHTQKYVDLELALGKITEADSLANAAETALKDNKALTYKVSLGIELTPSEQQSYTDNVNTFVESKIKELESRVYAANIQIKTVFGGSKDGKELGGIFDEFAKQDSIDMQNLSSQISKSLEDAWSDGILSMDEAQLISQYQDKMNSITAKWAEAQDKAETAWIDRQFGKNSGKALNEESFEKVVQAMQEKRAANAETTEATYKSLYGLIENHKSELGRNGRKSAAYYEGLLDDWARASEADSVLSGLMYENNTLDATYGDSLSANRKATKKNMSSLSNNLKSTMDKNGNVTDMGTFLGYLENQGYTAAMNVKGEDRSGLSKLWESMKPDASDAQNLVDQYVNLGKKIPKSIKDNFDKIMETGAAAGDAEAGMQVMANNIASGADKALIDAISKLDENGQLPAEFSAAWKRAMLQTDTLDLGTLKTKIQALNIENGDQIMDNLGKVLSSENGDSIEINGESIEVTLGEPTIKNGDALGQLANSVGMSVQDLADFNGIDVDAEIEPNMTIRIPSSKVDVEAADFTADITEKLTKSLHTDMSQNVHIDGGDVTVSLDGVNVDTADAATQIAESVNMSLDELKAYNGLDSNMEFEAGATIRVPRDSVTVDTSEVSGATGDAAVEVDPIEAQAEEHITVTDQTVDDSAAETPAGEEKHIESTATETTTVTSSEVDDSQVQTDVQAKVGEPQEYQGTGTINTVLSLGTENVQQIYDQVGEKVRSTFANPYSATATVNVTLNWHITNPSASISVSTSGTSATATIASAHANGGIVGLFGQELSVVGEEGPEYIIPTVPGRRKRGISLWEKAGRALGVLGNDDNLPHHANGGLFGSSGGDDLSGGYSPTDSEQQKSRWTVTGEEIRDGEERDSSGSGNDGGRQSVATNTAPVNVKVTLNPTYKIEGAGDEEKIFQTILNRSGELVNKMSGEIAAAMTQAYKNMPVRSEVW